MKNKKIIIFSIIAALLLIILGIVFLLNNGKKTEKPKEKKKEEKEIIKDENKKGVYSYLVKKKDETYELVLSNNIDGIDENIEVNYTSNEYAEGHFDSEKNIYVVEGPKWYKEDPNIKVTSVLIKNKIFPTKTSYWFLKFKYLETIKGLDNIVFDNVTSTAGMFSGCSSLTSLDLSSFNMKKVIDTSGMFASCSNLKTIYVNKENWNLDSVKHSNSMFNDNNNLIGSKGTKYDPNHIDKEYAKIDGNNGKGYLTEK